MEYTKPAIDRTSGRQPLGQEKHQRSKERSPTAAAARSASHSEPQRAFPSDAPHKPSVIASRTREERGHDRFAPKRRWPGEKQDGSEHVFRRRMRGRYRMIGANRKSQTCGVLAVDRRVEQVRDRAR